MSKLSLPPLDFHSGYGCHCFGEILAARHLAHIVHGRWTSWHEWTCSIFLGADIEICGVTLSSCVGIVKWTVFREARPFPFRGPQPARNLCFFGFCSFRLSKLSLLARRLGSKRTGLCLTENRPFSQHWSEQNDYLLIFFFNELRISSNY